MSDEVDNNFLTKKLESELKQFVGRPNDEQTRKEIAYVIEKFCEAHQVKLKEEIVLNDEAIFILNSLNTPSNHN